MRGLLRARGQGAFEYVLLLGGILLVVVLVIVILRGGALSEANVQVTNSTRTALALTSTPPVAGLLFLAHFNDELTGSSGEPVTSSFSVNFTTGVFGQGANVTGPANLSYDTSGNFNREAGTVGAFVRFDAPFPAGSRTVFDTKPRAESDINRVRLYVDATHVHFTLVDADNLLREVNYSYDTSIAAGAWHHYAASWDDATNTLKLYFDGLLQNTSSALTWDLNETSLNYTAGVNATSNGLWLNGTLDEFVVYARQIGDDEAQDLGLATLEVPT